MKKMLGYMLTWTTYGTWLQGDERGYVKHGKVLDKNTVLENANRALLKSQIVHLRKKDREIVLHAIYDEADVLEQKIYALAVCNNHVHMVVNNIQMSIGEVVSHYKNAARLALRKNGFVGKLWTKGYDKRFCFNESEMKTRIEYVQKHNENT